MVKERYVERTKIVKQKKVISTERFCDICGKRILSHYWKVESLYDNDYETKDLCSPVCLNTHFEEYLDSSDDCYNNYRLKIEHFNRPDSE